MNEQTSSGAATLTRTWVKAYTRGIPTELRDRRRAEVDSDLWEQSRDDRHGGRPRFETSLEIVVRLLLGVPADLSWRLEHTSPKRSATRIYQGSRTMLQTASKHAIPVLVGLLSAAYFAMAFGVGIAGEDMSLGARFLWGTAIGIAGFLLAAGLLELRRAPRRASIAIGAGAILGGAATFWTILTPVAGLIILVWLLLGTRKRRSPAAA